MTIVQLQAALDEANEKIAQLGSELNHLRPLKAVVEAQKKTIRAQQAALSAYDAQVQCNDTPVNNHTELQAFTESDRKTLPRKEGTYCVYCDGSCIGNGSITAPGGWAAIVVEPDGAEHETHNGVRGTTNNRMELTAAIEGLRMIPRGAKVKLLSDSQYVINGLQKGWAKAWRRNGWRKADGNKARNPDLWDTLLKLSESHQISYQWVRGHNGNCYNERCDQLANSEAHRQ